MSIIEIEIAKREEALALHNANVKALEEAKINIEALEKAVAETDEAKLLAEIEELKTYLPHPTEPAEAVEETAENTEI